MKATKRTGGKERLGTRQELEGEIVWMGPGAASVADNLLSAG